jgi:5'-3' exonuclease
MKTVLIDFHNFAWRGCFKFGDTGNTPDHQVFTFNLFRNLRPVIELLSPDKCYFVAEGKPVFRYELYPEYKANRKGKTKPVFFETINLISEITNFLPINIVKSSRYEADDLIYQYGVKKTQDF